MYPSVKIIHGYGSGGHHTSVIRTKCLALIDSLKDRYGIKYTSDGDNIGATIITFK
jgi:hypothetical protein